MLISSLVTIFGVITTSLLALYLGLFLLFKLREIEVNNKQTTVNMASMPILRPIPIPTSNQEDSVNKILAFVFLIRRWRVEEAFTFEYQDKKYIIPAGFEFDGASIPRPLWAILNPVGLLLIPGLIHDFGYRYNCIYILNDNGQPVLAHQNETQDHWDRLFRKIGNDVNGIPLLNSLAQFGLKCGGFLTWNNWREADLPVPDFKLTLKEDLNDSDINSDESSNDEDRREDASITTDSAEAEIAIDIEVETTDEFKSGSTKTTEIGYVNANQQKVHGTRSDKTSEKNQISYKVECLSCKEIYGSKAADIYRRKCPKCQDGKDGIAY